mgnify:CR=1 FL=1
MKNKRRKYILLIIIVILFIGVITIYSNYNNDIYVDKDKNLSNSGLSLMIETKLGSGEYTISTSDEWPTKGYEFNTEKSACENGGTLSWDEENQSVVMTSKSSDKCYAYFDIVPPDVTIAVNSLPATYGKLGSINCTNSDTLYNQKYNRIEISQINKKYTSCNLNYTDSTSKVNLATYITGLAGTTQGTGQVVNEKGYRYEGKNPNNYVWFNNEYWRIIGVFDSSTHGQANKNLVKIIRADVLGGLAWDKSSINDWTAASLNKLLNGAYYNAQDGTSSGDCYGHGTIVTANCDYTKKGIQSGYRSMIANVTWHLGSTSSSSTDTAEAFYGSERGTTVYSGNPATATGYIGLMYPSDYGYSVLSSSCARTTKFGSYSSDTCAGQSWLYGKGDEWTITPSSSNSNNNVIYLYLYANLNFDYAGLGFAVRPVLYLEDSVYKIGGEGSLENPYIIGA